MTDLLARVVGGDARHLLIGGQWVPAQSGRTFATYNPSTGEVLAQVAEGDARDVDRAVAAARAALEGPWGQSTSRQRQNVMLRFAELVDAHALELFLLDVHDMGRPIANRAQTAGYAEVLRYFAGWSTKILGESGPLSASSQMYMYTRREPIGVVGAIIPWNSPVTMALWKIAPALATGCTIVLKPAEQACLSPVRLGELACEAGVPDGVVNIVTGFGTTAGAALAAHPGVDKVAFTGSTAVGQQIVQAASGNLKRVSLELGGKSPNIVFADADLDAAAPHAAAAAFANSGQMCMAGTRLFVQRAVYEEVVERVAAQAKSLRVGNATDETTDIGPLVSREQLERVLGYLSVGADEGARAVAGGGRATGAELHRGFFVEPTVLADVDDAMRVAQEEIFGPVLSVLPFDDIDEVIRRANHTSYGLASAVWTTDLRTAHRVAHALAAGTVWINAYNVVDPAMPFGGYKMSGWGRELSQHALDEYTELKSVCMSLG